MLHSEFCALLLLLSIIMY